MKLRQRNAPALEVVISGTINDFLAFLSWIFFNLFETDTFYMKLWKVWTHEPFHKYGDYDRLANEVLNRTVVVGSDWRLDNLIFKVKVSCITSVDGIKF